MTRRQFIPALTLALAYPGGCASPPASDAAKSAGETQSLPRHKGVPWTILCLEVQGPDRVLKADRVADSLRQTDGVRPKDVRVSDDPDGFTRLYYGVYYRKTDPGTGKRAVPRELRDDMALIKQLGTGPGQFYFRLARMVPLPMPDVGNPEWALARATGVYTLQVAVFEPNDDFWDYKQAAADHAEFLRGKGYEAYYHHASGSSMVTVGSFGPDAVLSVGVGLPYYSREVEALQREALLKYNLVNGAILKVIDRSKDPKGIAVPVPSRLVHIPRGGPIQP